GRDARVFGPKGAISPRSAASECRRCDPRRLVGQQGEVMRRALKVLTALAALALGAAVGVPNRLHARKSANASAAAGALKTVATSQSVFHEGDREEDGVLDYGALAELSNVTLVDSVLGKGSKQGFYFRTAYSKTTSEFLWFAGANPQVATRSGDRYFETNAAGVIFYSTDKNLDLDAPPANASPEIRASFQAARRLATSTGERPQPPELLARPDGPKQVALPLEAIRIAVVLGATRARVLLDCTFANP